jgi:hypothetical protein
MDGMDGMDGREETMGFQDWTELKSDRGFNRGLASNMGRCGVTEIGGSFSEMDGMDGSPAGTRHPTLGQGDGRGRFQDWTKLKSDRGFDRGLASERRRWGVTEIGRYFSKRGQAVDGEEGRRPLLKACRPLSLSALRAGPGTSTLSALPTLSATPSGT